VLDQQWKDHLLSMDHLREGIGLRGYGQHDPLVEYKRESFDMFEAMMERFEEETVRYLYLMQVIERRSDGGPFYSSGGPTDGGTGGGLSGGPGVPVPAGGSGNGQSPHRQRIATTIDDIEAEFQRKKRRELDQARMAGGDARGAVEQVVRGDKVGRNDPCPCGSGKKYKKCCGA
jgi:preprotein translocase subunit SecA